MGLQKSQTRLSIKNNNKAYSMAQVVKHPFAMQEIQVQSLDPEVSLEEEMATYSSILACEILWTEECVGYSQRILLRT